MIIGLPNIAANAKILQNYVNALASVNAEALIIAPTIDEQQIRAQLEKCDGIILIGGADLPPEIYGDKLVPAMRSILSAEQTYFYSTIAKIALKETEMPVLGVCLGAQAINVVYGGTLYGDIYTEVPQALWHSRPPQDNTLETMHEVHFPSDSPLCGIIGQDWLCVNSSHHQAIRTLAPGMKATAYAKDGIVEAICAAENTGRFLLGVQWHPERLFDKVNHHKQIFQALVNACASQRIQMPSSRIAVIRGGSVCDGTGSAIYKKDILIQNGDILAMLEPASAVPADAEIINASGMLVTPGFIDAHAHSETRKLQYPQLKTKLLQGITTEVTGNCGSCEACVPGSAGDWHWSNTQEYIDILDHSGQSTNTVLLCGHNSLRSTVMGNDNRKPTLDEMEQMKALLHQALEAGAAGLSSGLTYFPGKFADTAELVELAREINGKVYATHVRNEADTLLEAAQEAIFIAEQAKCQLQFSHIKTMYARNHYKAQALIELLENAKKRGMSIQADRYPYIHSQTSFRQILQSPFDKIASINEYIAASKTNYAEIVESLKHSPRDLPTTIILSEPYRGITLLEAARQTGKSMEELATELLRDVPGCQAAYLAMSQENLYTFLELPWVCPGSDGLSMPLDDAASYGHPRSAATMPHFFHLAAPRLGIPETIRKMTSLPASIFNIPKRGVLRPGYKGDIVILDADKFDSPADFTGKDVMPTGIKQVFVSGILSYDYRNPAQIGAAGKYIAI